MLRPNLACAATRESVKGSGSPIMAATTSSSCACAPAGRQPGGSSSSGERQPDTWAPPHVFISHSADLFVRGPKARQSCCRARLQAPARGVGGETGWPAPQMECPPQSEPTSSQRSRKRPCLHPRAPAGAQPSCSCTGLAWVTVKAARAACRYPYPPSPASARTKARASNRRPPSMVGEHRAGKQMENFA